MLPYNPEPYDFMGSFALETTKFDESMFLLPMRSQATDVTPEQSEIEHADHRVVRAREEFGGD